MDKILVIDDEAEISEAIKNILEARNFSVHATSNWQDIENVVLIFNPDLIILDIALNGADGRVICKQLKANIHSKEIPILLMSANYSVEKSIQECNPDGFIAKPFKPAALMDKINFILQKKSMQRNG